MSAEWVDPPVQSQHGVPGKTLAAQREAMGWTVEQVADQLKLAVRQVVALEEGDYANLPGPAVVRGFVRAYAKVVKLDAAPLVAQIALDTPAAGDATATTVRRDKPTSFSQVRFPTNGKRASKLPLAFIGVAVLAIGGAAAAWNFNLIPASLLGRTAPLAGAAAPGAGAAPMAVVPVPAQPAPVQPEAAAKPAEALPPVISNAVPLISVPPPAPSGNQAPGMHTPAGVTPAGVAGVAGVAPAPAASAAPAPAAAPSAAPNALVLAVREDSWIEVRPAKGRALFSRLVKGGAIETITVNEPVTLIVGKPSAVDATLRGKAVALPAVQGGRVARVQLQ
jgi:cytoskeleton protein RodZ